MRDYGCELRTMRQRAGLTLEKVEEVLPHWPIDKLSRIERGRQEPKCSEYDELKEFYKANGGFKRVITYFRRDGGKHATLIVR